MQKLPDNLVSIAYDVVQLKGEYKQFDFGKYTDRQGELHLYWYNNKFHANLVIFSNPHTIGGFYLDPPETTWQEEEDKLEAVKIRDVVNWLKWDWGFELK